jgi:hypothetical protein
VNVGRIRGFLLQLPKPALVRVSGDGEPQELKPGKSYAKLADTIAALGPDLIECLDGDGKVLRACRVTAEEGRRSDAAALPQGLEADPSALMLTHFANLLHRAYEHSTEIAFTRLVELTERMNDRAESIEMRLERSEAANRRLLQEQVDDAFERAQEQAAAATDGGGDLVNQLGAAFLSGQMQNKTASAAAPKSNGHAAPKTASKGQS